MPYIPQEIRDQLDLAIEELGGEIMHPGELNYAMTRLALIFLERHTINYTRYSLVLGQFEAAKLEFYRRAIAPYEDQKILENGDVYA